MKQPTILLFNIPVMKAARIAALCAALQIQARQVSSADARKTIRMLADCEDTDSRQQTAGNYPFPAGEMMVFCSLTPETLDCFLTEYKKAGVPAIPLQELPLPYTTETYTS